MTQHPHLVTTEVILSDAEEAFVFNIARGMAPYRAAGAAGYSPCHAYAMLRRPHITTTVRSIAANLAEIVRTHLSAEA